MVKWKKDGDEAEVANSVDAIGTSPLKGGGASLAWARDAASSLYLSSVLPPTRYTACAAICSSWRFTCSR